MNEKERDGMPVIRTVELLGGPLDGLRHGIVDPFGTGCEPAMMGIVDERDGPQPDPKRHWYRREADGRYRYAGPEIKPEKRRQP